MKKQIILALALLIAGALPAQEKGSYLDFNIGGGLHNLSYSLLNGTEKGQAGYTLNAGYSYFFTPDWGFRTGLGFQNFSSVSTLNYLSSSPDTDSDGEAYVFKANYTDLKERQQVLLLDIPLAIQYRHTLSKKFGLLASVGAKVAIPFSSTFKTTGGEFVTTGYYSQWNVELSDMPQHGFSTMTNSFTGNTALKLSYMGIADLGGLFKLSEKLDLYVGGYVNYGLNNVLKADTKLIYQPNGVYNGLFASSQTNHVIPVSFGVKVGVYLHLGKNKHSDTPVVSVVSADSGRFNNQSNRVGSINATSSLNPSSTVSKDAVGGQVGSGVKPSTTITGQSTNGNITMNGTGTTDQSGRSINPVNPLNTTSSLYPSGAVSKVAVGGQVGSGVKASNTIPGQSSNANTNLNGTTTIGQSGRSLAPVNSLNATSSLNPSGATSKVAVGNQVGSGVKAPGTIAGQSSNANVNPNGVSRTGQSGRSLTLVNPLNATRSLNPSGAVSKVVVGGLVGSGIKASSTIPGQSSNVNVNPNGVSKTGQSGRPLTPATSLNATSSLNTSGDVSKVAVGGQLGTGIKPANTIPGQSTNANGTPNGTTPTYQFGRSTDSLSTANSGNLKSAVSKESVTKPAPRGFRKFINSILSRPSSHKLVPVLPIEPSNQAGKNNPDQSTDLSNPAGTSNSDQPIDPAFERAKDIASTMNLQFGFDSYQAANAKDANIKELSEILIAHPKIHLLFIGHTCDIGSREVNIKLGMKRVENVMQRFIEQGVPEIQLIGESKAFDDPLVPNTSAENRAKNRREEIKVFKRGGF